MSYSVSVGSKTVRQVRPLGLYFWGQVWTLVAWCDLRVDFRMFRLDRIGQIDDCGTFHAERDKTLHMFFAREIWRQETR